jgi:rSAM/selenodomain-associated transferase 2
MSSNANHPGNLLLSIIIPTLNEENNISKVLYSIVEQCTAPGGCEMIVVDGGSTDFTILTARRCVPYIRQKGADIRILTSNRGRALQMNHGAEHARGDILIFLHADTLLPCRFDSIIRKSMKSKHLTLGAFHLNSDKKTWGMKWICWWANLRARLFALPYGDQALFIRRNDFLKLNMFPVLEIMEDFVFVRKVRRCRGKITIVPEAVITSARRWRKHGYLLPLFATR